MSGTVLQQSLLQAFRQRRLQSRRIQSCPGNIAVHVETGMQTQTVHHELQRQFSAGDRLAAANTGVAGIFQVVPGMPDFPGTDYVVGQGSGDFSVGTRTNTQIVAELPVIEIVPALPLPQSVGGNFILPETFLGQQVLTVSLFKIGLFVVRQGGGILVEIGIGLQGQLIQGNMRWLQGDGSFNIVLAVPVLAPGRPNIRSD